MKQIIAPLFFVTAVAFAVSGQHRTAAATTAQPMPSVSPLVTPTAVGETPQPTPSAGMLP